MRLTVRSPEHDSQPLSLLHSLLPAPPSLLPLQSPPLPSSAHLAPGFITPAVPGLPEFHCVREQCARARSLPLCMTLSMSGSDAMHAERYLAWALSASLICRHRVTLTSPPRSKGTCLLVMPGQVWLKVLVPGVKASVDQFCFVIGQISKR